MPTFEWKGRGRNGQDQTGVLVADSKEAVIAMMRRQPIDGFLDLAPSDRPFLRRFAARAIGDAVEGARRLSGVGLDPRIEGVAHDREQPRFHAGAGLELVEVRERLGQGVLNQIVRIGRILVEGPCKCPHRGEQSHDCAVVTDLTGSCVLQEIASN